MKRDGNTVSLWQDTVKNFSATQPFPGENEVFDVVIVGGGITGITTGLQLKKAGKSVLIAEAQNIGFGTTGGTTAHLNTFFETSFDQIIIRFGEKNAQLVAKAARQALELIRRNIEEYNIDCGYEQKQGYLYSQDEKQSKELEKIHEASNKLGMACEFTDKNIVKIPSEKVLLLENQAQFHPTRYID